MADTNKAILSVIATTGTNLPNLAIKNGQLIFVHDKQKIALDFDGKRKFYNHINILNTDAERQAILAPISGMFYFVIGTAVLWLYQDQWIQITTQSRDIVYIADEVPELGSENTLYVDKTAKNIAVWNTETQGYTIVADKTQSISNETISGLFA